jgi:hypothetical protein
MKPALDFSLAWNMSTHEVTRLCKEGRVPGAELQIVKGKATWMIPEGTQRPIKGQSGPKPKQKPSE